MILKKVYILAHFWHIFGFLNIIIPFHIHQNEFQKTIDNHSSRTYTEARVEETTGGVSSFIRKGMFFVKSKYVKRMRYFMVFLMVFVIVLTPVWAKVLGEYIPNLLKEYIEIIKFGETIDNSSELESVAEVINDILYEIEDKREIDKKYFKMNDGSIMVTLYGEPVHYMKDGKWEAIDNTLTLNKNNQLENNGASYRVRYEQTSSTGKMMEIEKDGYLISFGLKNETSIKGTSNTKRQIQNEKSTSLVNLGSSFKYEKVFSEVDIEYITLPTKVKEIITLKTSKVPNVFEYTLTLDKNLSASLNEEYEVEIIDIKTKAIIYKIEAPFMYDANMIFSNDFKIDLMKTENNNYVYKITANKTWLDDKERVYPVVIDPTVVTDQDRTAIQDCYIYEGDTSNTTKCNAHILRVGNSKFAEVNNKPVRSIVQFELPSLETGDQVIDARFSFWSYNYDGLLYPNTEIQIDVHKLLTSWTESNANWSRLGAGSNWEAKVTDYALFNYSTSDTMKRYDLNVTRIVKDWYQNGNNHGLMLKSKEGSTAMRADAYLISSDTG